MSVKPVDEQAADLVDVQTEFRRTLDLHTAQELIDHAERFFNRKNYKQGRNKALDLLGLTGEEREAYKVFIDRVFQRRARAQIKLLKARRKEEREALKRPFAPRD